MIYPAPDFSMNLFPVDQPLYFHVEYRKQSRVETNNPEMSTVGNSPHCLLTVAVNAVAPKPSPRRQRLRSRTLSAKFPTSLLKSLSGSGSVYCLMLSYTP